MSGGDGNHNGDGNGNGGSGRLDSWKAIAAYLGKDETTLRRWEMSRGLPIRRIPGKRGGSVYAYQSEIDAWLQSPGALVDEPAAAPAVATAVMPSRRARSLLATASALLVVVVAALAWRALATVPPVARTTITESALTAFDGTGRELWTHRMEEDYRHITSVVSEPVRVITGNAARILVASAFRMRAADNQIEGGQLSALTLAGRLQWTYGFDDELTIGGKSFRGPWGTAEFAVEPIGGNGRIALAAHHYTWSPGMVAVLDPEGRRVSRFVNDGWLEFVRWLPDGRLAVGGYSESGEGGLVALLDPAVSDVRTPDTDSHRCDSCAAQHPLRVIVLPRSEVNLASRSRFNRAFLDRQGDRLVARTAELPASGGEGGAEAIYEFTADLTLLGANFNQRYWVDHDRLHADGALDHDRSRCRDREGPRSYRSWSPEGGWVTTVIR